MKTREWMIATVVTSLVTGPAAPVRALAQDDFPPPPSMNDFPPPPPPPASNMRSGAPSANSNVAKDEGPGMKKAQKDKFNRSGLEDITNENFPETIESFDFPNVEITDVIKTISELTGKNFIIDPGVRGKITIIAPSKLTVAEAYKAFLSSLAINGYTVVPSGSFLKVKNARNAQRDSIETYSGAYYPNDDQMITRIIHLKHIQAEVVNRELRILPSKDGEMSVYSPTNSIILSDYGSNIDRVMKIINQLDVPGFEEQIEVVPVKYAKSKDMAELIDKIVNKGQKQSNTPQGAFASGVPRFASRTSGGAQGQSGNAFFMAIADDRTNSIIIVGNKAGIARVKKLLAQLDFRIRPEDSGGVYVYYVKHGDAEKIAQVLQGVTKDAAPKQGAGANAFPSMGFGAPQPTGSEIFGGDVKITADKNTNSLVVTAAKPDYEQVLRILSQIDIPRDQVFVETVITEMTMNDANDWKIGYFKFEKVGKGGFQGGIDLASMLSPTGGSGAILPFTSGGDVTVTDPGSGKTTTVKSITGFINLLKRNEKLNVLSTPQILALDNQEAIIEVGEKIATSVTANTTATGQTTYTPNMEEATIKLKIKPFISPASESIRMELDQQIKQPTTVAGAPAALQANTQPLATRSIKTFLVVNNGDTAVLGGLMKDREKEVETKVPLLGDLPIIGWLFKSREYSRDKINLLVFLTPKIVRHKSDMRQILGRKLDERLDYIKGSGGKDPYGATMQRLRAAVDRTDGGSIDNTPLLQPLSPAPSPTNPPPQPQFNNNNAPKDESAIQKEMDEALELTEPPAGTNDKKTSKGPTGSSGTSDQLDFESGRGETVPPEIIE